MLRQPSSLVAMKESDHLRKRKKRLGGKGLGLEAFVKAKSKPSVIPSDIKKRREYLENAKTLKKYKTMINQLPKQDSEQGPSTSEKQPDPNSSSIGRDISHRECHTSAKKPTLHRNHESKERSNPLQRTRQKFLQKKQAAAKLKHERDECLQAKEEAQKKALQTRKELKSQMFKRTNTGQPVMKHRLQHILECLQRQ